MLVTIDQIRQAAETVEVGFVLQTRSHEHVRQVIEALARKGFKATLHLK